MPQLTHLDRSAGADAIFATIDRDGAVVVDDFMAPELLDALRQGVRPKTARTLPEHAQRMLGFRSYLPPKAARLGLVNYEDASALLEER